jgi:hypothetical protein
MATVNKDFKIKYGLIVEGSTATVGGYSILTKSQDDQNYIIGLIGGTATSANTANAVVKRDANGNFAAGTITANLTGNVTGTVSDISNHTTADLTEDLAGPYYFTDARAVTANTGLWDTVGAAADAEADAILAAQIYTDGEISDEVLARDAAILLAKNDAIADAASDATTKANAALVDANDYTDAEIITALSTAQGYANTAESNAVSTANSYTDGEITTALATASTDATNKANAAEAAANAYTDNAVSGLTWKQSVNLLYDAAIPVLSGSGATQLTVDGHDVLGDADSGYRLLLTGATSPGIYVYSSTGGSWTLTRSEDADTFEELVGAAVYVMEGTQYGSTSWVQSNHYLSGFAGQSWTQFAGQGSVTAGNGITVNGLQVSIDETVTATRTFASDAADSAETAANTYTDIREGVITGAYEAYADQAETDAISTANGYTDTREIAITNAYEGYADGVALTAEQNANIYTDGKITDEISDRNTAITNAINALTTSDIPEGTNEYFTDAKAKASAADLLTGPGTTLTNITITGDGSGLVITAENGVADSTTNDLAEGTDNTGIGGVNNLYFTAQRAVDALEAVVPNFTEVDINSLATQVAATTGLVSTASTVTAYAFAKADYRSAKFLVKTAYSTHTEVSEVLLTLDTSDNIAITEYSTIGTNGSSMTITADIDGSDVRLRVTTVNNNSTVTVVGTLLA